MLRTSLFILLLLFSITSFSQPVLGYNGTTSFAPSGNLFWNWGGNSSYITPIPGSPGGNKVWDFSSFRYVIQEARNYDTCGSTGRCVCYPGADILIGDAYGECFKVAPDGLYKAWSLGAGYTLQPYLSFPFHYNDFVQKSFNVTSYNGIDSIKETGIMTVSGYAWGTLSTPVESNILALLVKRTIDYTDSVYDNSHMWYPDFYIQHNRLVRYNWYTPGSGKYLFQIDSGSTEIPHNPLHYNMRVGAGYQDKFPLSAKALKTMQPLVKVVPNPASKMVQITLSECPLGETRISIVNAVGLEVRFKALNLTRSQAEIAFDVSDLPPNLYVVRIKGLEHTSSSKLAIR